ncbi:MAG: hypothetical protein LUC90_02520 [Lachnospiraceae bacterium]|nr:hypothetical protein [Lachnospiraceae bacterium]
MDFLWMICIFLLAANQNCCSCGTGAENSCGTGAENSRGMGAGNSCGTGTGSSCGAGIGNCNGMGPDANCGCADAVSPGRGFNTGSSADCNCCTTDADPVPDDCSCEVPQPLMPGSSGDFRTAQYPFPPYPVLRE